MTLLLTLATPAWPQGIDLTQGGPIQITARDGLDWRQAEQVVVARGDAKAVRGGVTVTGDRLIAWYRKHADAGGQTGGAQTAGAQPGGAQPGAAPAAQTAQPAAAQEAPAETETEGNEVYRLRAEGDVHIYTLTDQAWGDQATYDLDQAVLVMTGNALKLTTPNDTLTARDTMEYWSQKHMAVARGDAVVVTNDGRRISADTLVAYTVDNPPPAGTTPPTPTPASVAPAGDDTMAAMAGKLDRVEAFDHVTVRTATDIVTGDRAIYVSDTGVARVGGHVRITRGLNQINGAEAVVNMKTGIATLLAGDTGRVTGLVVPNDHGNPIPGDTSPNAATPAKPKAAQ